MKETGARQYVISWDCRTTELRKYRTRLMGHERLNFSRLLPADFLTCRIKKTVVIPALWLKN